MLYQLYAAQRSIAEPFADFAKAASKLFSNPSWAFSELPLAQRVSAAYDLLYRLGKDYVKPQFDIETVEVEGVEVAIHERIELDRPFCELRRFKRFSDSGATLEAMIKQPVVLIVAPLSGHYATLLRETVRTMLSGHKVYITDWKNARLVPQSEGNFHLDDYVNYVQEFIRHLQNKHGNIHVMSVCQPTVPVLAAISLMASRGETTPLSMVMMGGPIDARKTPTSVNDLAIQRSFEWFENNLIYRVPYGYPGEGRRVYPGFLQYTGFVAMNPDRHANSHYDYFRNLIKGDEASTEYHRKFYDEYNAVLDMDANYYLETIETVFQKFKLVEGTWDVRNPAGQLERVRPQDITTTALITVEGELDDISGSGQTKAAHTLCTGIPAANRTHLEVKGAGHYGIFSGSKWRNTVYPDVRAFFKRFQPANINQLEALSHAVAELSEQTQADLLGDDGVQPRKPARAPATAPTRQRAARPIAKTATKAQPKAGAAAKAAPKAAAKKTAARTATPPTSSSSAGTSKTPSRTARAGKPTSPSNAASSANPSEKPNAKPVAKTPSSSRAVKTPAKTAARTAPKAAAPAPAPAAPAPKTAKRPSRPVVQPTVPEPTAGLNAFEAVAQPAASAANGATDNATRAATTTAPATPAVQSALFDAPNGSTSHSATAAAAPAAVDSTATPATAEVSANPDAA